MAAKKKTEKVAEIMPLEAEQHEYRKPNRPTKKRLSEQPFAVVMLAWDHETLGSDPDNPADRDFEPFDNEADAREFFGYMVEWAEDDLEASKGVLWHATALVTDTNPDNLIVDQVKVIGGPAERPGITWRNSVVKHLKDNPTVLFSRTRVERVKELVDAPKKGVAKKAPGKQPNAKAPVKEAKKAPVAKKAVKEYTDAELVNMTVADVNALPSGVKGRALAVRATARKAAKEAGAAKAAPAPAKEAPAARKRAAGAPAKPEAKGGRPVAKRVDAKAFVNV